MELKMLIQKLSRFYRKHKRLPSYQEMADLFGYASKGAVQYVVNKLIEEKIIAKDASGKLIPLKLGLPVPFLGSIRAGLPNLRWHDLRHTWASWHRMAGTPDSALQELGGWASADMLQRYAHLAPGHVAAWAGNIGPAATARQVQSDQAKKTAPEGADSHRVGWLMGLEPTTTRITTRSQGAQVLKINDLRASKKPKTA
jgi:hypothetical protein